MSRNFTDKSIWNVLAQNGLNAINIATLGVFNTDTRVSVSYTSAQDSFLRTWFTQAEFAAFPGLTLAANGTLFGGLYQIVQVDSTANASFAAVGRVAYIKNTAAGSLVPQVTTEDVATANTEVAGIFLNTVLPGNFTAICIAGKVNVLCKASISNGSPAEGDSMFSGGGSGTVDDLATNVAWSTLLLGRFIGTALAQPANGATTPVQIRGILGMY